MKQNIFKLAFIAIAICGLTSCGDDFLSQRPTDKIEAGGPATQRLIEQNVASIYQVLLLDSYADGNYNSYILMGDLRSDDIFKGGGDANDQSSLFFLSQLKNLPTDVPAGWWYIYYAGISRANNAIISCKNAVEANQADVDRLSAEAHALRAYYLHNLWKMWGNIPFFEEALDPPYLAKQYTADEIYKFIMADLDYALDGDKLPMSGVSMQSGRVTKPVAQMIRARAVMYQNDQTRYNQVLGDMVEVINNPGFGLMPSMDSIFTRGGEFCRESIFEANHKAQGKTWGESWMGFGTNLPEFISPNGLAGVDLFVGGWGFAPVREEAYAMYSPDDSRRDCSINDFRNAKYNRRFQDTGFFIRKYAAREGYNKWSIDPPLNYENNLRIFRLPEAYLNAAELLVKGATAPGAQSAQAYLDVVRQRAFGNKFAQNKVAATLDNIKKERRLEFLGEGLRYWDLVRWGDAPTVVTENLPAFASVRRWDASKNKYLPIPQGEIDKTKGKGEFELKQNPY